ncbi:MAG: hypothetical protein AVDCRST_MAG74-3373 [uncultured Pyrinomonadaceae bacterium]|uniref:Uncharacterized protein n=1 Tax=uncultured Pyrinomonadaceae bacterium TaxID=2283094 RepID=A0A6J4Q2L9_9BACT|nr:MAG: hypothetical protein AVDCRST_MAG74-3373 [uncultured Pyrinomonadaceae bacterium]
MILFYAKRMAQFKSKNNKSCLFREVSNGCLEPKVLNANTE